LLSPSLKYSLPPRQRHFEDISLPSVSLDTLEISGLAIKPPNRIDYLFDEDSFGQCNSSRGYYLYDNDSFSFYALAAGCHSRFASECPCCARKWRSKMVKRFTRGIEDMVHPVFLTLTLNKRFGNAVDRDIWHLKKILFRSIRDLGFVIDSWCGVIEPPNHLHMVIDTGYIPQKLLSDLWLQITGDSKIVDIREVHLSDSANVASYMAKYITKTDNWTDYLSLSDLKGFHLHQSSGFSDSKPIFPWTDSGSIRLSRAEFDNLYGRSLVEYARYIVYGVVPSLRFCG
jgi:REP element-mobilizing transposase RayT